MLTKAEVLSVLQYPPDNTEECDRCHDIKAVWYDYEQEGDFGYCQECWQAMARLWCDQ